MSLYTGGGDRGKTTLIGSRRAKHDPRVYALGSCDELNSFVGRARAQVLSVFEWHIMASELTMIQHELYDCGSDLATLKRGAEWKVTPHMVSRLEAWIDHYHEQAPEIRRFILPGGSVAASELHICRAVARRVERDIAALYESEDQLNPAVLTYINRLSDYFFAAARFANAQLGVDDVNYERSAIVFPAKDRY
ncbi:cob(I)yrinic acid a,c-diamide adenosyltransferase [Natribacillus halophilus]|uniref:Corrinoid adenosyltransferase n=1 Tax=Natribacillus halophilus TaxID=549003 RepID=A0A1G8JFE4_9BACI|nr:cob(I)yrinic acid a,c-diamide adenosyltransferase [Natribacillus halophilus]SDI29737.1 cob(I)alamin adenosyltransferase [Natribacillus halophilus]